MTLVGLVFWLIVVGVLLWLVNSYGRPYIAKPILTIINVVVVVAVIYYILAAFGILSAVDVPVPRVR